MHAGEYAHGGVCMRHPVASEHTTHLLTTNQHLPGDAGPGYV